MPLPFFVSRSCPALLSVPLAGSDRVTLRYSVLASLVLTTPLSSAKFTDSEHILFWLFFNILSETFSIYRYVFCMPLRYYVRSCVIEYLTKLY